MPKPRHHKFSQAELSKMVGVSPRTLREWRDIEGLDLGDIEAVKARAGHVAPDTAPPAGETIAEAKRRRAVADADLAEMRARKESGEVVDLDTVSAAFAEIGHVLRARLLALPSELVSQLEGLSGSQMHQALKKHVHQLLHDLHQNNPVEKLAASSPTPDTATASHAGRG